MAQVSGSLPAVLPPAASRGRPKPAVSVLQVMPMFAVELLQRFSLAESEELSSKPKDEMLM